MFLQDSLQIRKWKDVYTGKDKLSVYFTTNLGDDKLDDYNVTYLYFSLGLFFSEVIPWYFVNALHQYTSLGKDPVVPVTY